MISTESLSKLLLTLYETPFRSERWPIFLHEFCRVLAIPAMAIHHHDTRRNLYQFNLSVGIDEAVLVKYEREFAHLDPYRAKFDPTGTQLALGEALCSTRELLQTPFYNDFLMKERIPVTVHAAGLTFWEPNRYQVVAGYRNLFAEHPGDEANRFFAAVLPHIRSALLLRQRIEDLTHERSDLEAAIDARHLSVLFLDDQQNVIFVSTAARRLIASSPGLRLRQRRIIARSQREQARLSAMIANIVATSTTGVPYVAPVVSVSGHPGGSLRILGCPIPRAAPAIAMLEPRRAAAMLFIRAPSGAAGFDISLFERVYGLTRAESTLTKMLSDGRSLKQVAEANCVSIETVRTQLKSVFHKTGASRQSELILVMHRMLPPEEHTSVHS